MNNQERIKRVKHHLIDKGISFREWCRQAQVPHSVARDLVYGRLSGKKSPKMLEIKQVLIAEFGEELFSDD